MNGQTNVSLAARFVQGIGLVNISPSELQSRLSACPQAKQGPWNPWVLDSITDQCHDALEFLSTLTFPATRHVVFARQGGSALVNNRRDGSDYPGYGDLLSRFWHCTFARIINQPGRVWSDGVQCVVMRYEARMGTKFAMSPAQTTGADGFLTLSANHTRLKLIFHIPPRGRRPDSRWKI